MPTLNEVDNPFGVFLGLDGRPLNGGKVYIGIANMDPETNPQAIYWDDAGTDPAPQPLATISGYIVKSPPGSPARVFTSSLTYSIRVKDRLNNVVFYAAEVGFELPDGSVTADSISNTQSEQAAISNKLVTRRMTAAEYRSLAAFVQEDRISPFDFGAIASPGNDNTTAFQNMVNAMATAKIGEALIPPRIFEIYGTLTLAKGITLSASNLGRQYFASEAGVANGATLYKPDVVGAAAGPIIEMASSSAIRGLYLLHEKVGGATTGIVRMGSMDPATDILNAQVVDCLISGYVNSGTTSGANVRRGIYFPPSNSGKARYFNRVSRVTINECDFAIGLNAQSNGNNFDSIITRDCLVHYQLVGGASECIENNFSGLGLFSIRSHSPAVPVGFLLQGNVNNNNFIGFNTETFGKAYDIDATAATKYNRFLGQINEAVASWLPPGWDFNYARGLNDQQKEQMLLPSTVSPGNFSNVEGNRWTRVAQVTGTLPNMNDNTGTLVAGGPDNRIIARFGADWFKQATVPNFRARLTVCADGFGTTGTAIAEVEFQYRTTNTTTGAGSLEVTSVVNKGSYISGLYFISGKTSGNPFAIALVGGNYAAQPFGTITVSIDVMATTSNNATVIYTRLSDMSFASEAVTANDVTDKVSLLTVADTAI